MLSGSLSLNRVTFTQSWKHPLLIILFQNGILLWHILPGPGLAWGRITGFKSSEFLQNKASLRQFHSEKNPITTLIEILFPSRSLSGHLLSILEYTFSTENKYIQLKLK